MTLVSEDTYGPDHPDDPDDHVEPGGPARPDGLDASDDPDGPDATERPDGPDGLVSPGGPVGPDDPGWRLLGLVLFGPYLFSSHRVAALRI